MEETLRQIAAGLDQKLFGKYRGFVSDNSDPDKRGRLRLLIPSVLGTEISDWALPCFPLGGLEDQGLFTIPEIDAQVWVEFEEGDIHCPIWTGTFWQKGVSAPSEAALETPTTRLIKTPSGHRLQFDDDKDAERIILHHKSEAELQIDKDGSVLLSDAKENRLTLDANAGKIVLEDSNGNTLTMTSTGTTVEDSNGNKIEMAASGIKIKGQQIVVEGTQVSLGGAGGEPVIKGTSFLSLFATHIHTAPPLGGPTTPPIPQGEASTLSTKVMTA